MSLDRNFCSQQKNSRILVCIQTESRSMGNSLRIPKLGCLYAVAIFVQRFCQNMSYLDKAHQKHSLTSMTHCNSIKPTTTSWSLSSSAKLFAFATISEPAESNSSVGKGPRQLLSHKLSLFVYFFNTPWIKA